MTNRTPSHVVQAVATRSVGRQAAAVALAVATVIGVWIGVNAPEVSPVNPPQAAAAQPAGTN